MDMTDYYEPTDNIVDLLNNISKLIIINEYETVRRMCVQILNEIIATVTESTSPIESVVSLRIDNMRLEEIYRNLICKCDEPNDNLNIVKSDTITSIDESLSVAIKSKEALLTRLLHGQILSDSSIYRRTDINLNEFKDIISFAKIFVEGVLTDASFVFQMQSEDYDKEIYNYEKCEENLAILAIEHFSIHLGTDIVDTIISSWAVKEKWLYCVNFVAKNDDPCSDYYLYEGIWSIPTKEYPIPQVTASVFFAIEVSRVISPMCPIKISYVFEGNSYVHKLNEHINHEYYLHAVLMSKERFFKTLTF